MKRQHFACVALATFAVVGLGAISLSGHTPATPDASPATAGTDATTPGTAALRAYLNPETGKVDVGVSAVAPEFDPYTENALRRDTSGLTEVRHADGTVSLDLQGRFQSVSVTHVSADGKVVICTDNADHTRHALDGDITASAAPEVK